MPTTFNIKFISDPVCPQCYIAKKRLDKAIELYKKVIPDGKLDIFQISWHAYYLANNSSSPAVLTGAVPVPGPAPAPVSSTSIQTQTQTNDDTSDQNKQVPVNDDTIPIVCDIKTGTCSNTSAGNGSIPIQEAMTRRFGGSSSTAEAMQSRLQSKGQLDGINFSFGNRIGCSRDAHRLIYYAGLRDLYNPQQDEQQDGQEKLKELLPVRRTDTVQNKVVTELFRRYFEENGDITSHKMLVDIAKKAGLNGNEVREWLVSGAGGDVVDQEAEEAVKVHGITGVPVIFINDTVRIDGAQDVEDFFMEFVKVREGPAADSALA